MSGQRLAADASLIEADANKQNSTPKEDWDRSTIDPNDAPRAVKEYLDVLDDPAFGAAFEVEPKFMSHADPASQWTAAREGPAFFSYSSNCLIDTDHSVVVDFEGTRPIRQTEVGSVRTMLDRIKVQHDIDPELLIADNAYGSGPMLGWLVDRDIAKIKQYKISMSLRKKVEMLFVHLKRILGLGQLRLPSPSWQICFANRLPGNAYGANDEFLLAATAQNLRKLALLFSCTAAKEKSLTRKAHAPPSKLDFLHSQHVVFQQNPPNVSHRAKCASSSKPGWFQWVDATL